MWDILHKWLDILLYHCCLIILVVIFISNRDRIFLDIIVHMYIRLLSVSVCACTFIFNIGVSIFHSKDTYFCGSFCTCEYRLCANFCVCTFVNVITGMVILHKQDVAVDHCAHVSLLCTVVCDYVSYLLLQV